MKSRSLKKSGRRKERACEKHIFKVLFCINGKKDATKLLTFGTWVIISEYAILINYLTEI
ncbi:hypothetical protein ACRRTK_000066 [Alexandromys fortis]